MREIKYRAKDVNKFNNGEWRYGYLVLSDDKTHGVIVRHGDLYFEWDINPDTASQFTGRKDKDGDEIYESHLCEDETSGRIHEVKFCEELGEWDAGGMTLYNMHQSLKIIGDKFSNPELLEQAS